uniref:Uncharacterized protein n=1 Tax=Setaria italica TaxID=4555 RepID=K3YNU0_SETIT
MSSSIHLHLSVAGNALQHRPFHPTKTSRTSPKRLHGSFVTLASLVALASVLLDGGDDDLQPGRVALLGQPRRRVCVRVHPGV